MYDFEFNNLFPSSLHATAPLSNNTYDVIIEKGDRRYNDIYKILFRELVRMCLSSAESYGIELREKVLGDLKDFYPLSKRREMLRIRNIFGESDFTPSAIGRFLNGVGVTDYNITENPANNIISVSIGGSYSDSEAKWIKKQVEDILPAHLTAFVYFGGKTWRDFELQDKTFAQLDALDLKWKDIHMQ